MKTKRVVALALVGALAFGGVLVTPPSWLTEKWL